MRKLKVFYHAFRHSLFPFDAYYKQVRKTHLSFSIKYFLVLVCAIFVSSLLLKTLLFTYTYPENKLRTYISHTEKSFPDDLVVTINSLGRLSSNLDRPYILFSPLEHNPRPLVVIDPRAEKGAIEGYNATILFGERRMYMNHDGSIFTFPYTTGGEYVFDSSIVKTISQNAQELLKSYWLFILIALVGSIIFITPLIIVSLTLSLTIAAFAYFILFKILVKHKRTSYKSMFQISLHAVTGPLVLMGLCFIFNLNTHIPMWNMLVLYLFIGGAVYESYFEK